MVERFHGQMQPEVREITLHSYSESEIALRGLNAAYKGHRQRVLKGLSPEMALRPRLKVVPALVNPTHKLSISSLIDGALHIIADVKKVLQSGGSEPLDTNGDLQLIASLATC